MSTRKKMSIALTVDEMNRIERLAMLGQTTKATVIRRIIAEYLDNNPNRFNPLYQKQTALTRRPKTPKYNFSNLCAFIVDSSPHRILHLQTLLEAQGAKVLAKLSNYADMINALKLVKCELLFINLSLEDQESIDIIKLIRSPNNDLSKLKIIGLVESPSKLDIKSCLTAGMNDFMILPISAEEIDSTLQKHFDFVPVTDQKTA